MRPACGCLFYLSLGPVRVCEIEISHMGKNNGNPDLVCENKLNALKLVYHVAQIFWVYPYLE